MAWSTPRRCCARRSPRSLAQPLQPDAVIASGDLTDCGLVEEYELLRDCLKPLPMPVYLIPGNHDRRENMRLVFGGDGYLPMNGEYLHYTVEDLPLRLIGLDTVVPGKGHGEMDAPRLDWLKARLDEQPDRPTLIFMHHPPFPTGLQHMDSINCRNAPAMAAILKGREQHRAGRLRPSSPLDPDPLGRHDRQRGAVAWRTRSCST